VRAGFAVGGRRCFEWLGVAFKQHTIRLKCGSFWCTKKKIKTMQCPAFEFS
jgi:hypothetical protein